MIICLLLAATCSFVLVAGECVFPSDNPIQDLVEGGAVPAQPVGIYRTYVYTDVFGLDCRGCVRALNFCYSTGNSENEELLTIEIRGVGNSGQVRDNYTVVVNSMRDRTNCTERYNLGHDDCCVEQTLSESLEVDNQNNFYALRIQNPVSLLLFHSTETVAGHWEDRFGNVMQGAVYKPLFYFVIDPSDGGCSTTTPGGAALTETTTDHTIESCTMDSMCTTDKTPTFINGATSISSAPRQQNTRGQVVYIGVGVSVGVVVLLAAGLILISGTVCLRRRSKKKKLLITSSNVAYNSTNAQLSVTNETSTEEYDYVSTHRLRPPHH
ncbi:hypothetical protein GBAR_LOCUS2603 [Geodia barretti]|uniref:Uncharacterized protein n=1 Tax=Geodia barretti TaxID=519541 RepID=A0AA35VZ09_GEOBA|nr:hypothetical protein GBAR_LOCUS2603 [Geodia barretti]